MVLQMTDFESATKDKGPCNGDWAIFCVGLMNLLPQHALTGMAKLVVKGQAEAGCMDAKMAF